MRRRGDHSLGLSPKNFDLASVAQLAPGKVKLLWHDNWWDGPLSGVIEYDGGKHYFDYYDPAGSSEPRSFVTIRLTEEEAGPLREEQGRWEAAARGFDERFGGRARPWDDLECLAWWASAGFPAEEDEHAFARSHPFYRRERVTGWFCERGTGRQFAGIGIMAFDEDGNPP